MQSFDDWENSEYFNEWYPERKFIQITKQHLMTLIQKLILQGVSKLTPYFFFNARNIFIFVSTSGTVPHVTDITISRKIHNLFDKEYLLEMFKVEAIVVDAYFQT